VHGEIPSGPAPLTLGAFGRETNTAAAAGSSSHGCRVLIHVPADTHVPVSAADVEQLVDQELSRISDPALLARISGLRVPSYAVVREWDYGLPDEAYSCWTVVEHRLVNVGIAYCEAGFGPQAPWGLVFLSGPYMSIGMDSGWFTSLEEAARDLVSWDQPSPGMSD